MAKKTKYGAPLSRFAKEWGTSARTIGGLSAKDAPLRDVVELRTWWESNVKKQVPEWLLKAEDFLGQESEGKVLDAAIGAEVVAPDALDVMREVGAEEVGLAMQLRRMRVVEVNLSERANRGEPAAVNQLGKISAELAKLETKFFEQQVKEKFYVERELAETVFVELSQALLMKLRTCGQDFAAVMGLPYTPEVEGKWNRLADEFCEMVQVELK